MWFGRSMPDMYFMTDDNRDYVVVPHTSQHKLIKLLEAEQVSRNISANCVNKIWDDMFDGMPMSDETDWGKIGNKCLNNEYVLATLPDEMFVKCAWIVYMNADMDQPEPFTQNSIQTLKLLKAEKNDRFMNNNYFGKLWHKMCNDYDNDMRSWYDK
jgi:hypothetical protein